MNTTYFLDIIDRAARTAAQSVIGVFVAGATVMTVDWAATGAIVGTATLVSVLTSISAYGIKGNDNASMVRGIRNTETPVEDAMAR